MANDSERINFLGVPSGMAQIFANFVQRQRRIS